VYNEPYIDLIGQKHPALQGQDPKIQFAEIWDHFEKLLADQRETGETTIESDAFLLLYRHGFLEETYFSWKFVPIIGIEGWTVGSHATVIEVTRQVISDRRLLTIRSLRRHLALAKTTKELWRELILGLESAEKDIPMALLFSVSQFNGTLKQNSTLNNSTSAAGTMCTLESSIGVPDNHRLVPAKVDLHEDDYFFASYFRDAIKGIDPVEVPVDEHIEAEFAGVVWRGFGISPTRFVVCPIIPADSHRKSQMFGLRYSVDYLG
jgi:hypothetical protein